MCGSARLRHEQASTKRIPAQSASATGNVRRLPREGPSLRARDHLQRAVQDFYLQRQGADWSSIHVKRQRGARGEPHLRHAESIDLRAVMTPAVVNRKEVPDELTFGKTAENADVKQSVVEHRARRDRERAAVVRAVGDDDEKGVEMKVAPLIPEVTVLPALGRVGAQRTFVGGRHRPVELEMHTHGLEPGEQLHRAPDRSKRPPPRAFDFFAQRKQRHVEPDAGGLEKIMLVVGQADIDATNPSARQHLTRRGQFEREPEIARHVVERAERQDTQRRIGVHQPFGDLARGAVATGGDDHAVAVLRGASSQDGGRFSFFGFHRLGPNPGLAQGCPNPCKGRLFVHIPITGDRVHDETRSLPQIVTRHRRCREAVVHGGLGRQRRNVH